MESLTRSMDSSTRKNVHIMTSLSLCLFFVCSSSLTSTMAFLTIVEQQYSVRHEYSHSGRRSMVPVTTFPFLRPIMSISRMDIPTDTSSRSSADDSFVFDFTDNEKAEINQSSSAKKPRKSRWESLNPRIKDRIIAQGQKRAIANKEKRQATHDKKRST
jgi:hypothetical protein